MSSLRSALDELAGEDLNGVSDEDLDGDLVEIRSSFDYLQAEFIRRVAVKDQRRTSTHLSTTAFLVDRCRMGGGEAGEKVRMARALEAMPFTRHGFGSGELTYPQVRILTQGRESNPEVFSCHEETLVKAAAALSVADTRRVVDHWRIAALPQESAARAEAIVAQRWLYASPTFEGMVRLDGWFDPVDGDTILTALAAATAPRDKTGDDASAAQRRADGLADICRQWLADGAPEMGGEKPHIDLLVDLETLENRTGKTCELSREGVIDPETARMLACDAGLSRIITQGPTQPLDVGRRTRIIPPAIRRALVVRDRGCRHPGCGRPATWCEAHHLKHWTDGGETKLDNLILLCRRHHRTVHSRAGPPQ